MYPDPDAKRHFGTLDAVLIALVLGLAAYAWFRVSDVLVYRWNWSFLPQVLFRKSADGEWWIPNVLLLGLLTTIRLAIWSMLLASVIGVVLGVMATLKRLLPRLPEGSHQLRRMI